MKQTFAAIAILGIIIILLITAFPVLAQTVPTTINYQGRLTDNTPSQTPITNSVPMVFSIFDNMVGGTQLWTETWPGVDVVDGIFSVLLGSNGNPIPASVFTEGTARYLEITAAGETLTPRQPIGSVGYANQAEKASDSDALGGIESSSWQMALISPCSPGDFLTGFAQDGTPTCASAGGVTDHGALTGLSDDDHPQYFNLAQNETVTGIPAFDGGTSGASAPFSVDSTTVVTNLNADLLDGLHAGSFYQQGGNTFGAEGWLGTNDTFALNLEVANTRALRIEPGTSPNLIGGYSGNWIASGTFGAVIGGGGQNGNLNRVVDHVGVVGGGQNNQAGSDDGTVGNNTLATVGGGANNTASGTLSAITGGTTNTAGGYASTVSGGRSNSAGSQYAFVGGGYDNEANGPNFGPNVVVGGQYNTAAGGDYSFIGGGANNQVTGGIYNAIVAGANNLIPATNWGNFIGGGYGNVIDGASGYSTIAGGRQNTASTSYVTVAGGRGNSASGSYATVAGGQDNTASGSWAVAGGRANTVSGAYATVPGGVYGSATHFGEMAYASGGFAVAGDAQTSVYVLRREYAMAAGTWHDLFLDGNSTSQRITIADGRTVSFDILFAGRTSAGESAGYRAQGLIENVGGTTTLVGTPIITVLGEDDAAWNVQVLASDTLDALMPQVQGNGETIRWVARVETAEVSWNAKANSEESPEPGEEPSKSRETRHHNSPEGPVPPHPEDPPRIPEISSGT
ncbi:MAG TPA: hypothetical protein PK014_00675 [Thermoanaerobaculia bacterium]|nr:hypothetical protein [Thermoanaerobaculia bacterium]HUM29682.1 hypothetical protein [Thermoanaerobaculia bacterium]HXK66983.1 hypothetical protein [Thermoanaerobaculia bacterium]